jgi:hypothetical protein
MKMLLPIRGLALTKELRDLLKDTDALCDLLIDVAAIPDDKIREPDLDVDPTVHHVCGTITDMGMKRLFTGYADRVHKLAGLHAAVKGPMLTTRNIPSTVRAKMMEIQNEMDLLRVAFFYILYKRFNLFDKNFLNVHRGWLVSWSHSQAPTSPPPKMNLGSQNHHDNDDQN